MNEDNMIAYSVTDDRPLDEQLDEFFEALNRRAKQRQDDSPEPRDREADAPHTPPWRQGCH